ncbi:CAP-GLY domain-containing linker protein 1 [Nowakowskiella sp. JEL0407]|nr:CAP-GLY domain-containing linker protein 1 [Nowakowskiella sp. JEL0407]
MDADQNQTESEQVGGILVDQTNNAADHVNTNDKIENSDGLIENAEMKEEISSETENLTAQNDNMGSDKVENVESMKPASESVSKMSESEMSEVVKNNEKVADQIDSEEITDVNKAEEMHNLNETLSSPEERNVIKESPEADTQQTAHNESINQPELQQSNEDHTVSKHSSQIIPDSVPTQNPDSSPDNENTTVAKKILNSESSPEPPNTEAQVEVQPQKAETETDQQPILRTAKDNNLATTEESQHQEVEQQQSQLPQPSEEVKSEILQEGQNASNDTSETNEVEDPEPIVQETQFITELNGKSSEKESPPSEIINPSRENPEPTTLSSKPVSVVELRKDDIERTEIQPEIMDDPKLSDSEKQLTEKTPAATTEENTLQENEQSTIPADISNEAPQIEQQNSDLKMLENTVADNVLESESAKEEAANETGIEKQKSSHDVVEPDMSDIAKDSPSDAQRQGIETKAEEKSVVQEVIDNQTTLLPGSETQRELEPTNTDVNSTEKEAHKDVTEKPVQQMIENSDSNESHESEQLNTIGIEPTEIVIPSIEPEQQVEKQPTESVLQSVKSENTDQHKQASLKELGTEVESIINSDPVSNESNAVAEMDSDVNSENKSGLDLGDVQNISSTKLEVENTDLHPASNAQMITDTKSKHNSFLENTETGQVLESQQEQKENVETVILQTANVEVDAPAPPSDTSAMNEESTVEAEPVALSSKKNSANDLQKSNPASLAEIKRPSVTTARSEKNSYHEAVEKVTESQNYQNMNPDAETDTTPIAIPESDGHAPAEVSPNNETTHTDSTPAVLSSKKNSTIELQKSKHASAAELKRQSVATPKSKPASTTDLKTDSKSKQQSTTEIKLVSVKSKQASISQLKTENKSKHVSTASLHLAGIKSKQNSEAKMEQKSKQASMADVSGPAKSKQSSEVLLQIQSKHASNANIQSSKHGSLAEMKSDNKSKPASVVDLAASSKRVSAVELKSEGKSKKASVVDITAVGEKSKHGSSSELKVEDTVIAEQSQLNQDIVLKEDEIKKQRKSDQSSTIDVINSIQNPDDQKGDSEPLFSSTQHEPGEAAEKPTSRKVSGLELQTETDAVQHVSHETNTLEYQSSKKGSAANLTSEKIPSKQPSIANVEPSTKSKQASFSGQNAADTNTLSTEQQTPEVLAHSEAQAAEAYNFESFEVNEQPHLENAEDHVDVKEKLSSEIDLKKMIKDAADYVESSANLTNQNTNQLDTSAADGDTSRLELIGTTEKHDENQHETHTHTEDNYEEHFEEIDGTTTQVPSGESGDQQSDNANVQLYEDKYVIHDIPHMIDPDYVPNEEGHTDPAIAAHYVEGEDLLNVVTHTDDEIDLEERAEAIEQLRQAVVDQVEQPVDDMNPPAQDDLYEDQFESAVENPDASNAVTENQEYNDFSSFEFDDKNTALEAAKDQERKIADVNEMIEVANIFASKLQTAVFDEPDPSGKTAAAAEEAAKLATKLRKSVENGESPVSILQRLATLSKEMAETSDQREFEAHIASHSVVEEEKEKNTNYDIDFAEFDDVKPQNQEPENVYAENRNEQESQKYEQYAQMFDDDLKSILNVSNQLEQQQQQQSQTSKQKSQSIFPEIPKTKSLTSSRKGSGKITKTNTAELSDGLPSVPKSNHDSRSHSVSSRHSEKSKSPRSQMDDGESGANYIQLVGSLRREIASLKGEIQEKDILVEELHEKEKKLKVAYQILVAKLRREVRRLKFQRNSLSDPLIEAKYFPYLPRTPFGTSARKPPIGIIGNLPPRSSDYFALNPPPPTGNHPESGNRWWWGIGPNLSSHLPPPRPKTAPSSNAPIPPGYSRKGRNLRPYTQSDTSKIQTTIRTPVPPGITPKLIPISILVHPEQHIDSQESPSTAVQAEPISSPHPYKVNYNYESGVNSKGITHRVGDRVFVVLRGERCPGTIKYVGPFDLQPETGLWCGIKLEKPVGKHDGVVRGKRYFQCEENYGMFVKADKVFQISPQSPKTKSHNAAPVPDNTNFAIQV